MHGGIRPAVYRLTDRVGFDPDHQCCNVTGEIIWAPKRFGLWCPLEKEESEDEPV